MAEIQAVVFDIDGTLVNTREFIFQAYEYSIHKHGYPVPDRTMLASMIGHKIEECYARYVPGIDVAPLIADHVAFQREHLALIRPYEGVREMLETLFAHNFRIVLWTSRRAHVQEALEQTGIADLPYSAVIGADMVAHGKPDPEGFLLSVDRVGAVPEHAAMVGDAPVDIEAGQRGGAGMTVAVTYGFGARADLVAAAPTHLIDTPAALPDLLLQGGQG